MLRQKRRGTTAQKCVLVTLGLLVLLGILFTIEWAAKNRREMIAEMKRQEDYAAQFSTKPKKEPALAPYQTRLFRIGDTDIIFDPHVYTPTGNQSLLLCFDAARYGLFRHLDDVNGFFAGKYASQGHVMPYDVGEVQRILHDQGVTNIRPGDGALIRILELFTGKQPPA